MKASLIFVFLAQFMTNGQAQTHKRYFTYSNFERQVIQYQPKQNALSTKDFKHGLRILTETKEYVGNNPENFTTADYYNLLSCFLTLKEDEETIRITFSKLKNAEGSCEYFADKTLFEPAKYDRVRERISKQRIICERDGQVGVDSIDLQTYSKDNNLDLSLVTIISEVLKSDAKYRSTASSDWSRQDTNDKKNQKIIDSLYLLHRTYIGKTLVGEQLGFVMWAVIQHSNLEMMEKYLPIVHQAFKEQELDVVPLKMLIDRYYGLKYGYQFFGSQDGFGFDLADDEKLREIKLRFGID